MLKVTLQESETGFEMKKQVSWKGVFVREYNVTVGDHPLCSDNLPLSLDWEHSGGEQVKNIDCSRERKSNYVFPKRLSYEDRRRRIFGDGETANEQTTAQQANTEQQKKSLLDLDEALLQDEAEMEACQSVIYCRHALHDEDDVENDDDDDDDSLSYFLDWRRFAGI